MQSCLVIFIFNLQIVKDISPGLKTLKEKINSFTCKTCCMTIFPPISEWTGTMLKFLKEQLMKLQEYYQHSSSSSLATGMSEDQKIALKQWQYCTQLTKYMYQV